MSGICGICEPGRQFHSSALAPMMEALALSDESERITRAVSSVAFGVSRRWPFQQFASFEGISVLADADLVDSSDLFENRVPPGCKPYAEAIARQYLRRGTDVLRLLHGAFSLAIWDERSQHLLLSIDRLGIKSLYWRQESDRLLFASRAGAVREVQAASREVNPTAILQFLLFSAVPAPLTSDKGTHKLRPGTFLRFERGRVSEHIYWDLQYPESDDKSVSNWAARLREGMRLAVHRHLRECEPEQTGCYLSGGTDSSSVVAFASEVQHPARSFSVGFQEAGFSEIEFARTTARIYETDHHECWVTPAEAEAAIDKIIDVFDEPFANSSAVGSYYCALLARQNGVATMLAGDGGDELFGGNQRYAQDKRFALYHSVPAWMRRYLVEPLAEILPSDGSKLSLPRKYVRRANIPNPRRILSYGFFLNVSPQDTFVPGFLEEVGLENWLAIPEGHFHAAKASCELNRLLYLDVKMTLADNDLRKVCSTAELAGVNVRYPLLDDKLAELSGEIPAEFKLKGFEKRYIFKQAMKDLLPPEVLYKKKHGFGVPLSKWLLSNDRMREMMEQVLHDSQTRNRNYFQPKFLEKLMTLHKRQPGFYGEIVWYLVALELWHRRHFDCQEAVRVV